MGPVSLRRYCACPVGAVVSEAWVRRPATGPEISRSLLLLRFCLPDRRCGGTPVTEDLRNGPLLCHRGKCSDDPERDGDCCFDVFALKQFQCWCVQPKMCQGTT